MRIIVAAITIVAGANLAYAGPKTQHVSTMKAQRLADESE